MKILVILALSALVGCFDTSPPPGVVGDIVGCIEAENSIYCLTEYPVNAISLDTIVDDVSNNGIRFQQQIVTVTGEASVFTDSIILDRNEGNVDFWVFEALSVWKLEEGETYQITVFIRHINRDRNKYEINSSPVGNNLLDKPAVSVNTIATATLADATAYKFTALHVRGTVERKGDRFVVLTTEADNFRFSVYSRGEPDLLSPYQVGTEHTLPVYVSSVHEAQVNSPTWVVCDYIKNY